MAKDNNDNRELTLEEREALLEDRSSELSTREAAVDRKESELNDIGTELEAREKALNQREQALDEREKALAALEGCGRQKGIAGRGKERRTCLFFSWKEVPVCRRCALADPIRWGALHSGRVGRRRGSTRAAHRRGKRSYCKE